MLVQQASQVPTVTRPLEVLGLSFANRLGLAAGLDRTGAKLANLASAGAGHVEIGTITNAGDLALPPAADRRGLVVGLNFASPRYGLDGGVVEDYAKVLEAGWSFADYLVANLSGPFSGRTGDMPGLDALFDRLASAREARSRESGNWKPLFVKIGSGEPDTPLPRAVSLVLQSGFDGVVLVGTSLKRVSECRRALGSAIVISVGGIGSIADAERRLGAGASLVQVYSLLTELGPSGVCEMLRLRTSGGQRQ